MKGKLLVIDDEKLICWSLQKDFGKAGYQVITAESAQEGTKCFDEAEPDVVLLDIRLPDGDGQDLLHTFRKKDPSVSIIMITANDGVRIAVDCMKAGAFTYIHKPFEFEELRLDVEKAMETRKLLKKVDRWERKERDKYDFQNIISGSPEMKAVLDVVRQIVDSEASTVLLEGESGTGKDLIAQAIHYASPRASKSFVSVNCAALPETLLESELFGHEKGAFTDARQAKKGLVEEAQGGTLFLDEIGDMEKGLQAKLLHLIDQKKFRRVGGVSESDADIRIIAATNKNLKQEVEQGRFREDLYYRLKVIPIFIPPLREHKNDIPALVKFFIANFNREFRKNIEGLDAAALDMLMNYHWPGNVRELKNVIERAMILNKGGSIIAENLPSEIDCRCIMHDAKTVVRESAPTTSDRLPTCLIGVPLEDVEKGMVLSALESTGGNQSQAAKLLGIGRDALRYKMQKFGIEGDLKGQDCAKSLS